MPQQPVLHLHSAAARVWLSYPTSLALPFCLLRSSNDPPPPPLPGARETIRFLPPLTVSAAEVEEGLATFEQCLEEVLG